MNIIINYLLNKYDMTVSYLYDSSDSVMWDSTAGTEIKENIINLDFYI